MYARYVPIRRASSKCARKTIKEDQGPQGEDQERPQGVSEIETTGGLKASQMKLIFVTLSPQLDDITGNVKKKKTGQRSGFTGK